jgi:hypothetical protein
MNGHRLTGPTGPFRANFGLAPLHLLAMLITSMKLVFLHGSPAVGKLTVAKALLRMVSVRLFDNHAAIDLARTVFEIRTRGDWASGRQKIPAAILK